MPESFMRLGEAAKILDVSIDSLRRYEAQGLITYRRMLGMRVVTAPDLQLIRILRATHPPGRRKMTLTPPRTRPRVKLSPGGAVPLPRTPVDA